MAETAEGPAWILVRGARTHNLKNIDVAFPAARLVVITGVSGSGKSSLAFDTLYAEGQRRYVESLSAYARQFLERMEKPDVDAIEGLAPAIAIRQKSAARNPRSTVATTTELYDYLRLLFARVGRTICRSCGREVVQQTPEVAARTVAALPAGTRVVVGFDLPIVSAPAEAASPDRERGPESADEDVLPLGPAEPPGPAAQRYPAREAVQQTLDGLARKGFRRILVDSQAVALEEVPLDALVDRPTLPVVVDRIVVGSDALARLTDSLEVAYREGGGAAFALEVDGERRLHRFSERFECRPCGMVYEPPHPRLFSFNSPFGACPTCHGFGNIIELDLNLVVPDPNRSLEEGAIEPWSRPQYRSEFAHLKRIARTRGIRLNVPWAELTEAERQFVLEGDGRTYGGVRGFFRALERKKYKVHVRVFLSRYRGYLPCPECGGTRLRREARDVRVGGRSIDEVCALTVGEAAAFFNGLVLESRDQAVAGRLVDEIRRRLGFLRDVGLDYLTLDRLSSTLSGGEAQRISLATALGSALVGTLYVLDEPSIGLHPRDTRRLIDLLERLRDQGNTVVVVEHDAETIRRADYVIDLGLGAGEHGGRVVYQGPFAGLLEDARSLTAKYLRGELAIPVPPVRRRGSGQKLRILGAAAHNLKNIDVEIPLNTLTCVTGVSGSGKSTLVHDVLYAAIKRAKGHWDHPVGAHRRLEGAELVHDAVLIDQTPIGRSPRSNPVTYLKAFDAIRELFAATKEARARGLTASHFSFNVPGGRCEACEGEGEIRVDMQFLADVFVPCEECEGKRFKPRVLEVRYRGRTIHEVLGLTVREALQFFSAAPKVTRRLQVLDEIGLGYLKLGQPAPTLSGGEAQRIKIAAHLASEKTERTLYILDEPTTGLHFDDIAKLLGAFRRLLAAGHTLVVIEHHLDVIKTADWVIDLGPEGGARGGWVVAAGTPEQVAEVPASYTGQFLRRVLASGRPHAYAAERG